MIILDTNVVSEPMRLRPSSPVLAWLDRQSVETLYLTTVNLAELLAGVEILPEGKRKRGLEAALSELVDDVFGDRMLPFDQQAAGCYARIVGQARRAGQVIAVADGQIAAIAAAHGFTVATRDRAPFQAAGVAVINPWQE